MNFSWEEVIADDAYSFSDISIAVAQAHPTQDRKKVKSLAYGIYHYQRLIQGIGIWLFQVRKEFRKLEW